MGLLLPSFFFLLSSFDITVAEDFYFLIVIHDAKVPLQGITHMYFLTRPSVRSNNLLPVLSLRASLLGVVASNS